MTTPAAPSFLDRLVARAAPVPRADAPVLERRRPGLFEPRGGVVPSLPIDEAREAHAAPSTMPHAAPMPIPPPLQSMRAHAPSVVAPVVVMASAPTAPSPAIPVPPRGPASSVSPATTNERPSLPPPVEDVASPRRIAPTHEAASPQAPSARAAARLPAEGMPARQRAQRDASAPAPVRIERSVRVESRTHERVVESRIATPASPLPAPPPPAIAVPMPVPPRVAREERAQAAVAHPGRTALHAPAPRAAMSPPPVQVSIGRIEIRAQGGTSAASRKSAPVPGPRLGLDDYLRQRHGSG